MIMREEVENGQAREMGRETETSSQSWKLECPEHQYNEDHVRMLDG